MSIREAFRNAPGPAREEVELPSLGVKAYVRQVTAGERDDFELSMSRLKGKDRRVIRARIVAMVTVEEDGSPVFGPDDVEWLTELPVVHLEPIMDAHQRLNAMSRRDQASLEKN